MKPVTVSEAPGAALHKAWPGYVPNSEAGNDRNAFLSAMDGTRSPGEPLVDTEPKVSSRAIRMRRQANFRNGTEIEISRVALEKDPSPKKRRCAHTRGINTWRRYDATRGGRPIHMRATANFDWQHMTKPAPGLLSRPWPNQGGKEDAELLYRSLSLRVRQKS